MLDARYWILDTGYWRLVKTVANATASVQYPESSIKDRLGTARNDGKINRKPVEKLERRL
jgi:hypothetical protein